ncbi:MAG: beta-galactosidase [Candidatus Bathyarchaeia archaeon]
MGREYTISFYTWWEPEKSSDEALEKSLKEIKALGFDKISFDIQYTWYVRKEDYWERLLRFTRKERIAILPVVTYGYLPGASILESLVGRSVSRAVTNAGETTDAVNASSEDNSAILAEFIKKFVMEYKEDLMTIDSKPGVIIWEPSMVMWGKLGRRHLGYDSYTINLFREWCRRKYGSIGDLNKEWGANFNGFDEVTPPRIGVWEGEKRIIFMQYDKCWDDWCLFRAEILARFYEKMITMLKEAGISTLVGLSQHGVIVQHDAFQHRCIYLPYWKKIPATRYIVSTDLYCKSISDVKICMEAELGIFCRYFKDKVAAYITPVESLKLIEKPSTLIDICDEFSVKEINFYAWNEMGDGANLRDHINLWDDIRETLQR